MRVEDFGCFLLLCLAACSRTSAASFLPSLDVRLVAERSRDGTLGPAPGPLPWSASVVAHLRWQPKPAAQSIPARAELAPEIFLTPCEGEDVACLEEAAESEQEVARLLGELE